MTLPRIRPPLDADERTQLVGWLNLQRAIAAWKCEGLSEEDAHRSVLPTSPRAWRRSADRKPGHAGPPAGARESP